MTAKVPTIDIGIASEGITVAERLRRKRKITSTTRVSVMSRVTLTSLTESRIDSERSNKTSMVTDAGSWDRKAGSRSRDSPCHLYRVGAGLALDGQDDGALVDEPGRGLVVLHVVDDSAQLLETHRLAAAVGDDDWPVLGRAGRAGRWPERCTPWSAPRACRWGGSRSALLHGRRHLVDADAARGQLRWGRAGCGRRTSASRRPAPARRRRPSRSAARACVSPYSSRE